jgi:hypothetical protein
MNPEIKINAPAASELKKEKNKLSDTQAASQEDWEGGASRPTDETVPAESLPNHSPSKNLQAQAESVIKPTYGDSGPPKNLQSLPTQNTREVSSEKDESKKDKRRV